MYSVRAGLWVLDCSHSTKRAMHGVSFWGRTDDGQNARSSTAFHPCARCSTGWKTGVGRRKLGELRALSIPTGPGLWKPLSPHLGWRMQEMAPCFFIAEGTGSGICRDSALGGTGQVTAMGRAFCPQSDWLFIIISCSSWVFPCNFRREVILNLGLK